VYEHDTGAEPAFAAVIVTTSPATPPASVADIVGVLSLVTLSVVDVPVSDAVARSTTVGTAGATLSIVAALEVVIPDGPDVPCRAAGTEASDATVTEVADNFGVTVPSEVQPETVTTYVAPEPDTPVTAQPEATPEPVANVKSDVVSDDVTMLKLNDKLNVACDPLTGVVTGVMVAAKTTLYVTVIEPF